LLNKREHFRVKQFTLFVSLLTHALSAYGRAAYYMHMMRIIQTYYTSFGAAAQRPESLMLGTEHRILYTIWLKEARTGSSSSSSMTVNNNKRIRNGADSCFLRTTIMIEKTLIISIDDDVSAMSSPSSTSSSTLGEGTRSNNNDHNQENPTPMTKQQEEEEKKKDRKVRVVSFRLSKRDYERHLSMAKLCHENGLTKGPDIVSYIRLSMECLWHYINNNSPARVEPSAEEKKEEKNRQQQPEKKQEGGVEQQHD
jgi:hypothetical protein